MDDLTSKINEFLSNPDAMEKIKNMASLMSSSSDGGGAAEHTKAGSSDGGGLPFDPATMSKMAGMLGLMKKGDPRVELLIALKPNLSDKRRKKVDEAINLLRIIKLMPLLREQGLL